LEAADIQFTSKTVRRGLEARALQAISDMADVSADHRGLVGTVNYAIDEFLNEFLNDLKRQADAQTRIQQLVTLLKMKARRSSESGAVHAQQHFQYAAKALAGC
jgi:cell shape-determining protein MreC